MNAFLFGALVILALVMAMFLHSASLVLRILLKDRAASKELQSDGRVYVTHYDFWNDPESMKWFEKCPPEVQKMVREYPPDRLYMSKDLKAYVVIKSYFSGTPGKRLVKVLTTDGTCETPIKNLKPVTVSECDEI